MYLVYYNIIWAKYDTWIGTFSWPKQNGTLAWGKGFPQQRNITGILHIEPKESKLIQQWTLNTVPMQVWCHNSKFVHCIFLTFFLLWNGSYFSVVNELAYRQTENKIFYFNKSKIIPRTNKVSFDQILQQKAEIL